MAQAGAEDKLDWSQIDTVLLDMDGTLLDLNFDLHFWMEYMPLMFANKHNLTHDEAKDKVYPILRAEEGKLHWYCLDYWQKIFELDIAQLKEDVSHLIQIHPFVLEFLEQARQHNKRIYLVTNAHRKTIQLKMRVTNLEDYFDDIITSHDYGAAKEDQGFWHKLDESINLDKAKSVFFDDSLMYSNQPKNLALVLLLLSANPALKLRLNLLKGLSILKPLNMQCQ